MTPKHAGGRPKSDTHLTQVTFKASDETIAMLDDLCADMVAASGGVLNGGKSQAIRKAIELAHQARAKR